MIASRRSLSRCYAAAACALSLVGCTLLRATQTEPPRLFTLDATFEATMAAPASAPTLYVSPPGARPGFDGRRMAYVTRAHELQFFAQSEWVDAPARMLGPLLVQSLERRGRFQVTQGPSGAGAALRLDSEVIVLQQEFASAPSRIRFALRAELIDVPARRVVATDEFEAVEEAASDDPYGGVVAANAAVSRVLRETAEWAEAQAQR